MSNITGEDDALAVDIIGALAAHQPKPLHGDVPCSCGVQYATTYAHLCHQAIEIEKRLLAHSGG